MERMGPRRAGDENGDGTIAGRTTVGPTATGAATAGRTAAVVVAVAAVAALAGCSVTVQPKNAAAARPLTSSTPTATPTSTPSASGTAPSTSAASSTSASPTVTPSDVDHTVCSNVRDILATLKSKLEEDKDSASRSAQDYRTAGTALRVQDTKTDNSDLRTTLKTVGIDYQNVGHDVANHESPDADLGKAADASKPLSTLCGGGSSSGSSTGSTTGSSTGSTASATSSSSN